MKWHYICRCGVKYEKPQKYCLSCRVKGQVKKIKEDSDARGSSKHQTIDG